MDLNQNREPDPEEGSSVVEATVVTGESQSLPGAKWRPLKPLTLVLMLVVLVFIVTLALLRDEPVPWDDDLRDTVPVQQQQDVSAPARMKAMLTAAAKISVTDPVVLSPWVEDVEKVGALLDNHGPVLDNLRDLLEEKREEWDPRSLLWKMENDASNAAWTGVMLLKEAECAYLARRGHEEAAFHSACDLLVLSSLIVRLDAWPNYMDRFLELQEHGTRALARLLSFTQLDGDRLHRLQEEEYKPWAPTVEQLKKAMDGFYLFERKLLLGPEGDEPPLPMWYLPARSGSRIFFKPNTTLRLFAGSFRELKNEAGRTAFSRASQIEHRLLSHGLDGGANRSGEDYFAARIRAYASLLDRNALARTRHGLVMALFGVRQHVQRERSLPAKLDDLVPRYLSAVPLDSFSGEALRYDAKSGLIWSVGMDFKDDGGRPTEIPMSDHDEPTVGIGVATAKAGT